MKLNPPDQELEELELGSLFVIWYNKIMADILKEPKKKSEKSNIDFDQMIKNETPESEKAAKKMGDAILKGFQNIK